tara:strand:- start:166 stop:321 length:156 start_codon:yes stop_codon:yes gene_type:complete
VVDDIENDKDPISDNRYVAKVDFPDPEGADKMMYFDIIIKLAYLNYLKNIR